MDKMTYIIMAFVLIMLVAFLGSNRYFSSKNKYSKAAFEAMFYALVFTTLIIIGIVAYYIINMLI